MESNDELHTLKNAVVTDLFVDTADQNYLIARWAYHRGMYTDFYWNAVHALEKYLKASLLLNDRSGIRDSKGIPFGHDIVRLLNEVTDYSGDLLPNELNQPAELNGIPWHKETLAGFISRLNDLGDAHNRYNLFGYVQRWEDLSHLDQAVWYIRRLACRLAAYPFISRPDSSSVRPETVRELLRECPEYSPRSIGSRLQKLLAAKGDDELRDAGLKLNFVFAPKTYDHGLNEVRLKASSSNSALYQYIVERAEHFPPSSGDIEAADLSDWVVQHIYLPPEAKAELKDHAQKLRNRSLKND